MSLKNLIIAVPMLFMACACSSINTENPDPIQIIAGQVVLTSDNDQIRCDGVDAVTFAVEVIDAKGVKHDVTSHSEIYFNYEQQPLSSNVFTTTAEGEYVFYAIYGMSVTAECIITAISDAPELPADPQEDNVSFRHRMLLVQHTGATCSNCPRMMESLRTLSSDPDYSGLYHHVASHSYNGGESDPAYSDAARNLSMAMNTSGLYPMLTFNLTTDAVGTDLSQIKAMIDQLKEQSAVAGIAAAAKVSGEDVLVNVEVKAAEKNNYRVAAWLLEDDIYAVQSGMSESWHNTHHNALRYMAGTQSQFSFVGDKLGMLYSGEKADKMFVIPVEEGWKVENCKVLVFVTAADSNGNYRLANCAVCSLGGTVSYDYH